MAEPKVIPGVNVRNLYQRLLAITEEIGKIDKTGKNTQQGYAFIEQAKIVAELRPQLAKHGVMIIPETLSRAMEQVTNKNGTVFTQANVISRYTLINADDPQDRMTCDWDAGEALDTSDKASNKAITASHKSFLMKLFNISDKDDPDAHSPEAPTKKYITPAKVESNIIDMVDNMPTTEAPKLTKEHVAVLVDLAKGKGATGKEGIIEFINKVCQVDSFTAQPDSYFATLRNAIIMYKGE